MVRYLLLCSCFFCHAAVADLKAFACEPEWASLLQEIGGTGISVTTALTMEQDPHYLQARPSLIVGIRGADLLVCSGAQLEIGWLPLLLQRSGNQKIQSGQPGHVMAAMLVRRLDIPRSLDRAQGDVHPEGNPHVHLDPANILRIAKELQERMIILDPENADLFETNGSDFTRRWMAAMGIWRKKIEPLRSMPVIVHHSSFTYLTNWLGLRVLADIEPKPGIPPSGSHLAALLTRFEANPPAAIIKPPYVDGRPSAWLSERLHAPAVELPYTVGGQGAASLFEVMDITIDTLLGLQ